MSDLEHADNYYAVIGYNQPMPCSRKKAIDLRNNGGRVMVADDLPFDPATVEAAFERTQKLAEWDSMPSAHSIASLYPLY